MKKSPLRWILQWTVSLSFVGLMMYALISAPRWTARGLRELTLGWMARHAEQADRECAQYDDAMKDPARARGKAVRWFVSHPGHDWFCGDDQSRRVLWSSRPPDMMETGQSGQSRGLWVRASIDSAGPGGVALIFERFE